MNNPIVNVRWRCGSCVVLAVALRFGVAADAAPRVGDDPPARGADQVSSPLARLVTGDPAQINAVVAGTQPTAILGINPVPVPAGVTPPNPYPPGTTIVGNELRAEVGGFRAWFNVQVSNWDPDGDGSPILEVFQVAFASTGYFDSDLPGDQPDLAHARVRCLTDADCVAAFGEAWTKCEPTDGVCRRGTCASFLFFGQPCTVDADCAGMFCSPGYFDMLGTGRPDSWCAPSGGGCVVGFAHLDFEPEFALVSASATGRPDGGIVYYGATLVLDIPTGAKGRYKVPLDTGETFMASSGRAQDNIPTLAETGFVVNIVTGSCCFGLGTPIENCRDLVTRSECEDRPAPRVFNEERSCIDASCVTLAQCELHEDVKLTATDAAANDLFGVSVSVSGDTAVVGAAFDDCAAGVDCGSAYVYRFNGSTWVEQGKLNASDAAAFDYFGESVSVSGDLALVGAYGNDCAAGFSCGSAYIYRFNGSTWVEEQKLTASDAVGIDYFGSSVSVSENVAVVGAVNDDCPGTTDCGSAYVYRFNGSVWVEEAKLAASDAAEDDRFGVSASLSGDFAVIGATSDNCATGDNCGAAYVFRYNGSTWVQQVKLTASDATAYDYFGGSVSVSGDTIFVGAYGDGCAAGCCCGSTYVYRFNGSTWEEEQKLTASDAAASDYFGESVSVSGDVAVIGSAHDDCATWADCGSAYFYRFNGSAWVLVTKLTASDSAQADYFGVSVSVSGDMAVIGARYDDCAAGSSCGSAYVFELGSLPSPSDCNANLIADECDIASGTSADCNGNGVPDECQQLPCPPVLGACCETISGACLDEVLEAECQGIHRVWTSGASCGDAACSADTGACCDYDPFGECTDYTVSSDCRCATCTWHKLQACAEIDCAQAPIPTVSEWGLAILTLLLLTGAKIYFVVPEKPSRSRYLLDEMRRSGGYTLQETQGVWVKTLQNRNGFHASQTAKPRRL